MILRYINKILFTTTLIITMIMYVFFLFSMLYFIITIFIYSDKSWIMAIVTLIIGLLLKTASFLFNNIQDNNFYDEDIKLNIINNIKNNKIDTIKGLNKIKQQLTQEDLNELKHYFINNNEKFKMVDNYNKKSTLVKKVILNIYSAYVFYFSKLIVKKCNQIDRL